MAGVVVDYQETYSSDNFEIRDANGALTAAATTSVALTLPDLTTSSPTVNNPSTGIYSFDVGTVQAGRHLYVFTATGGGLGTVVRKQVGAFIVRPPDPVMFIDLEDARRYVNEQSRLQDEEIRAYVQVASEIVESIAGPIQVRTITERVRGGTWSLRLRKTPVMSVTSITSIPTPTFGYVTADLDVDSELGYVFLTSRSSFQNGPWTAVYKAGRIVIPERYQLAAKEQLWHMWVTQRGQTADSITPDLIDVADYESRGPFGLGFLIPKRVMELLDAGDVPGVA